MGEQVLAAGETYRRIGVSAFAKHHQLRRDLLIIVAVPKSSLTSPDADTPTRRPADTLSQPAVHFEHKRRYHSLDARRYTNPQESGAIRIDAFRVKRVVPEFLQDRTKPNRFLPAVW